MVADDDHNAHDTDHAETAIPQRAGQTETIANSDTPDDAADLIADNNG